MTTQTEALKLALEALETIDGWLLARYPCGLMPKEQAAITAIKEALAQPEQPKVRTGDCLLVGVCASEGHKIQKAQSEHSAPHGEPVAWLWELTGEVTTDPDRADGMWLPLYTTPPQRTWVGLDNDDLVWIYSNSDKVGQAISNTEAKLKKKNTK